MFAEMRDEIRGMIDERFATMPQGGGGQQQPLRPFVYKDFQACKPPVFEGETDPIISQRWVKDIEGVFRVSECPARLHVRFVTHMLRGAAKDWWGLLEAELPEDEVNGMT